MHAAKACVYSWRNQRQWPCRRGQSQGNSKLKIIQECFLLEKNYLRLRSIKSALVQQLACQLLNKCTCHRKNCRIENLLVCNRLQLELPGPSRFCILFLSSVQRKSISFQLHYHHIQRLITYIIEHSFPGSGC